VSWVVVAQEGHSDTGNHLFWRVWPERLRNVRLAALDLDGSQGWIWRSRARNGVFGESRVSPKFTSFSLSPKC